MRFLVKLIIFLCLVFAIVELSSIVNGRDKIERDLQYENVDGSLLYAPNTSGRYNQPFNTLFRINSLGFNSVEPDSCVRTRRIALVGDSFIAGLHTDYNKSIANNMTNVNGDICVVEFGIEGNIHDYNIIYEKYNLLHYDNVFIFLTGEADISYLNPQSMSYFENPLYSDAFYSSESFRLIYNKYINYRSSPNEKFILKYPNVTYVAHFGFNSSRLKDYNYIDLDKALSECTGKIHFKNDSHWNEYGREKVAEVLLKYIESKYE